MERRVIMNNTYTAQEVLKEVFNTPELYSLIVPDTITPYGIFWGGSRHFGLATDSSDYDLNIIVSLEDYLALEKDHKFRPSIYFNDIRLHWYYIPVNIRFFNFEVYAFYGLEWWSTTALKQLSKSDFLAIYDDQKIDLFINNLQKSTNLFREMLAAKYTDLIATILEAPRLTDYLHKKSYIFLLLGSLLANSLEEDIQTIRSIKSLTANIEHPTKYNSLQLSSELAVFITEKYQKLYDWLIA
jgi:hypothetical protein